MSGVGVNDRISPEDLDAYEKQAEIAAPGEWRLNPAGDVVRWGGEPVEDRASRTFMARARAVVPRLLRYARALERALEMAEVRAASDRREMMRERDAHEQSLERARGGKPGPEDGLDALVALAGFGPNRGYVRDQLRRWSRGEDIGTDVRVYWLAAQRRLDDRLSAEGLPEEREGPDLFQRASALRAKVETEHRERIRAEVADVVAAIGKPAAKKLFEAGFSAVKIRT